MPHSTNTDIVILEGDVITLLELTIPIKTKVSLQNARDRKQAKKNYVSLLRDLETRGFTAMLETVEIGSLGHFSSDSVNSLLSTISHLNNHSIHIA